MPRPRSRTTFPSRSRRRWLSALLTVLYLTACTSAPRLGQDEIRRALSAGRNLSGHDLRGLDLAGLDLRNAILRRAILRGANLEGADLTAADLTDADLVKARLVRATLRHAILRDADLEGAALEKADLTGAVLVDADLEEADLRGAQLQGADLTDADLADATLEDADLSDAVLVDASLADAKLSRARLSRANLTEANLRRADLSEAILDGADLSEADLEGANLQNASLLGARLTRADLREANLEGARLDSADLTGARLERAHLHGASLQGTRLEGAALRGTQTRGGSLTWRLPPPPSEELRAQLGTIGVVAGPSTTELRTLSKRRLAAGRGALVGAGSGSAYGVSVMIFFALLGGLIVPPVLLGTLGAAAVGGGLGAAVGAMTGEGAPPAVRQAVETLRQASADVRLEESLRDHVTRTGGGLTRHRFLVLPTGTTLERGAGIHPSSSPPPPDALLETRLLGLALVADSYEEAPALVTTVGFRLTRAGHGTPAYEGTLAYSSQRRPLAEWASEQGRPFRAELDRATASLAERIVEELFLVYAQ